MIILFIDYDQFILNFSYLYSLFIYLNIKIKLINNIYLKEYITNNFSQDHIYIFYEIFDEELFKYINTKYNKNIYYFINNYKNPENLQKKFNKINYILISNSYLNIINFKYKKLLLNHQMNLDIDYEIENINHIIVNKCELLNNYLDINSIEYQYYDKNNEYNNCIIIINNLLDEQELNKIIFQNNILIIKNFNNLELYFFYNNLLIFDNYDELNNILKNINNNIKYYFEHYKNYMNYFKKKLSINNKKFYKNLEKNENYKNKNSNKKFGFIILRHVNSKKSNEFWYKSIENIRKYYRNKIYIIDDNSNYQFINKENEKLIDVEIIESKYKQRGEILPYYYLYIHKLFDQCLIIHDSVFINKYINFFKYKENIHYLWHIGHESNDLNNEINMMNKLSNDKINNFYDNQKWYGCFGCQSIIKLSFVNQLQEKFKIFNLIDYIDNRTKRMNFERIFSVLCTMLVDNLYEKKSIYGNIKDYIKWEYSFDEYIKEEKDLKYLIVKTWSGR